MPRRILRTLCGFVLLLVPLFAQAAADPRRAWVVADHERPVALAGVPLAAWIDLGD